jgi:putative addiction module component (TIGR02574 family)
MSVDLKDLLKEAMQLPREARAALAEDLLQSLDDEVDEDVEAAWAIEIKRRVEEIRSGNVKTVPWSEVQRQVRETLAKHRGT